jgi:histidinol-phosphate/aromatic aminotransferase/cobyric acid decarboxylase-like protein
MYIKHCEGKSMSESDRYVRIASRTPAENTTIVAALSSILAPKNNANSVNKSKFGNN